MNSKVFVLIGPPGSGKTAVLDELKKRGHHCFPEVAREIIREHQENGSDQLFLDDPLKFSELLLKGRVEQFLKAKQEEKVVFLDRGIPDISTYMDHRKESYPSHFHVANIEHRYDKVFFFPFWEEIYQTDKERYEDGGTAKKLGKLLRINYKKAGYTIRSVPKKTIAERADFIESKLNLND
jgi:predicted ATPase